jgi:pilus assembly protein Flp/PilA
MKNIILRSVADDSASAAVEYGVIAAGISVAILAVVNSVGSQLTSTVTNVSAQVGGAGR